MKVTSGESGIEICRTEKPDAIILNIMLPGIDGIEVCKKIREFSICSILFLSSKSDDIDRILRLSSGGDDYVTNLFSPKEVAFRIKARYAASNMRKIMLNSKQLLRSMVFR